MGCHDATFSSEGKDGRGQCKAHREVFSCVTIGTVLQKRVGEKELE